MTEKEHEIAKRFFIVGGMMGFMVGGTFVGIVALVSMVLGKAAQ